MATEILTSSQLFQEINQGNFKPVYLFMGEESYYIDLLSDSIQSNALTEEERGFNETILYGAETNVQAVIDECNFFPSFAQRRVVILKEAQALTHIDELETYLLRPQPTTILIINYKYGNADKRKKWVSLISKIGIVFESKKLYENQVPDWIAQYLSQHGHKIDLKASVMLVEFLGTELSKIAKELDKLLLAIPPTQKSITAEDIEKNIGISKDYNNFELQKAIIQRDYAKTFRIVDAFNKNPKANPIMVTISVLFTYFSNLLICFYAKDKSDMGIVNELKLRGTFQARDYQMGMKNYSATQAVRAISYLREFDAKSKGFGSIFPSQGELLKEMIFKIMH